MNFALAAPSTHAPLALSSNPTPEASEASRGNTSAHPSNNPSEERAPFNPTPEASEASRGNTFNAYLDTIPEPSEPSAVNFFVITGAIHKRVRAEQIWRTTRAFHHAQTDPHSNDGFSQMNAGYAHRLSSQHPCTYRPMSPPPDPHQPRGD